jgi:hypothetical protein
MCLTRGFEYTQKKQFPEFQSLWHLPQHFLGVPSGAPFSDATISFWRAMPLPAEVPPCYIQRDAAIWSQ